MSHKYSPKQIVRVEKMSSCAIRGTFFWSCVRGLQLDSLLSRHRTSLRAQSLRQSQGEDLGR